MGSTSGFCSRQSAVTSPRKAAARMDCRSRSRSAGTASSASFARRLRREFRDVLVVGDAVIAEDVAEGPELLDDVGGGGYGVSYDSLGR